VLCLVSCPVPHIETLIEAPTEEITPDLAPTSGPACPVCGSTNTYTKTDERMVTWIVCMACGANSC
jgi:hypothetical protein